MAQRYFPSWQDEWTIAGIYHYLIPSYKQKNKEFTHLLGYRLYTEWCLESERNATDHLEYEGDAFKKFVNDEVHFLLERQQKAGKRQSAAANNHEDYQNVRNKVLEGLVRRALNLIDDKGHFESLKPEENLRCDLRAWIGE